MKISKLLVAPLLVVPLIASCGPAKTVERTVSFNIPDCKMYYGTTEISKDGTKINIPNESPFKTKFSVISESYMKPSKVTLDKELEYTFNKDNGDLEINLSSDVSVTGTSDIYKSLEECTWAQIKTISESGKADTAFYVGEEKTITLSKDGQSFTNAVRILDFDYDPLADDSNKNAGITFEFVDVIKEAPINWNDKYITQVDTQEKYLNYDFVNKSSLNDALQLNGDIYKMMPNDLMEAVKFVTKPIFIYNSTSENYNLSTYNTKLFPLSRFEICEDSTTAPDIKAYKYYQGEGEAWKQKCQRNEKCWLRTPFLTISLGGRHGCLVMEKGVELKNWPSGYPVDNSTHEYELYCAPAFCI